MTSTKVSVVLTTYNGMRYLKPLLDSLRNQTRKINEVLICDDGSTDGTREYIVQYISEYGLTDWKPKWNKENYGWMKNFRIGIQTCEGDLIFPCDQDDIWSQNKIQRMTEIMEKDKSILLLSSDYTALYEDGGNKVDEYDGHQASNPLERVQFGPRFALHERPGCVMGIRKELVDKTRNLWKDWYPHDAFIWTVANLFDGCCLIHEPLINYRRHDSNASTGSQHVVAAQVNSIKRTLDIIDWRCEQKEPVESERMQVFSDYRKFAALRLGLLNERKVKNWFKLLAYSRFYRSQRQLFGDWYYLLRKNS